MIMKDLIGEHRQRLEAGRREGDVTLGDHCHRHTLWHSALEHCSLCNTERNWNTSQSSSPSDCKSAPASERLQHTDTHKITNRHICQQTLSYRHSYIKCRAVSGNFFHICFEAQGSYSQHWSLSCVEFVTTKMLSTPFGLLVFIFIYSVKSIFSHLTTGWPHVDETGSANKTTCYWIQPVHLIASFNIQNVKFTQISRQNCVR